jgi:hypothetical protein
VNTVKEQQNKRMLASIYHVEQQSLNDSTGVIVFICRRSDVLLSFPTWHVISIFRLQHSPRLSGHTTPDLLLLDKLPIN